MAEEDNENREKELPTDQQNHRVIDSESILMGRREVWIRHRGEMYRLRLTSSGRLYLSK